MKAAQITDYGPADSVKIVEVEKPAVGAGQVLVEVHTASLNPFDTTVREGYMREMIPLKFPVTLGGDIAGVITEAGADVTGLKAGDKVYGQAAVVAGNSGAFAEFAAVSAGQLAKMPANVDFTQAAALPLVGVSALQAVSEHIKLAAGQKILIHGGAGSIGSIAVQLAKHLGAHVAATATGEGLDYAKDLGADEIIDYKTEDFTTLISDYDAVFDTVGGDVFARSFGVLKPGGVAVSMIAPVDEALAKEKNITALTQGTRITTAALESLRQLVEDGVVTARVGRTFPLAQVSQAFETRETGKAAGKIVLTVH